MGSLTQMRAINSTFAWTGSIGDVGDNYDV